MTKLHHMLLGFAALIPTCMNLCSGRVLAPKTKTDRAIVAFNRHVRRDNRIERVILPVGDRVTPVQKKTGAP